MTFSNDLIGDLRIDQCDNQSIIDGKEGKG